MKYLKIIISFIGLCTLGACQEDYLERYPLDTVSEGTFFSRSSDMMIYMNQFYNRTNFPLVEYNVRGDFDSDIQLEDAKVNSRLQGTNTINSGGAFAYTEIRAVNYFLKNYKKSKDDFEKHKQYVGEAYFFRAFFYYGQLQRFGAVPWISTVLSTDSPELFGARDPRNVIADNIIADLDTAAMYLSADKTNGHSRINKWIALLFQSRVALFEGTWEKYHNGTPFGISNPQPAKYFNKVVEATTAIMNSGLYDIYNTGKPTTDYVDLFGGIMDYSTNKEVMFWSKMNLALGIYSYNRLTRMQYPEGMGLTKSLADSYLCKDGLPIATSPLFKGYANLTDESTDRDPRFKQTIFTPDVPWMIENGVTKTFNECYNTLFLTKTLTAPTGYMRRKHYNPNTIYHVGLQETPTIQYRYAEVLLNFIEAKAELGTISQGDIDVSIKKLRDRVGMPNLILASIPNDPNWDFPTLPPVINEIRRERKIELCLEELRFEDILRWAAADELIIGKRPLGAKKAQFTITPTFSADANGFIDVFKAVMPNGWGFNPNRDYLLPIAESQITLNPNITQNPGW